MKKGFIILLISIATFNGYSQTNNVVKLNLGALAFTNFSFQYERVIKDNMSGALGLSYMPSHSIFDIIGSRVQVNIKGYAITPEFRYYLGKRGAPKGFYFAPYLRHSKLLADVMVNIEDPHVTNLSVHIKGEGYRSTNNLGLMMGAQFLINDKISLDFFLGGHAGKSSTSIIIPYDVTSYSDEEIKFIETQVAWVFEKIGQDLTVKASEDKLSVTATRKGSNIGSRVGICIGYAF